MRAWVVLLFAAVPTLSRGTGAPPAAGEPVSVEDMFRDFVSQFGRSYGTTEEASRRLAAFAENLEHIRLMQMEEQGSAVYSHLTPFADWTAEEFSARNGFRPSQFQLAANSTAELLDTSALPNDFDWRAFGWVNPVKDQGSCGSCWAFATVANIEGAGWWTTKRLLSLSEQELIDCDKATGDKGCHGGNPAAAYQDMIAYRIGLMTEPAYPYRAKDGVCLAQPLQEMAFITGWAPISADENQIAAALMTFGPLAIGINADAMKFYFGGIADPSTARCNPMKIDHGVTIVGFGTQAPKLYWTIRNSWGARWGEHGYYRIARGKGSCGLNLMVTTATGISILAAGNLVV